MSTTFFHNNYISQGWFDQAWLDETGLKLREDLPCELVMLLALAGALPLADETTFKVLCNNVRENPKSFEKEVFAWNALLRTASMKASQERPRDPSVAEQHQLLRDYQDNQALRDRFRRFHDYLTDQMQPARLNADVWDRALCAQPWGQMMEADIGRKQTMQNPLRLAAMLTCWQALKMAKMLGFEAVYYLSMEDKVVDPNNPLRTMNRTGADNWPVTRGDTRPRLWVGFPTINQNYEDPVATPVGVGRRMTNIEVRAWKPYVFASDADYDSLDAVCADQTGSLFLTPDRRNKFEAQYILAMGRPMFSAGSAFPPTTGPVFEFDAATYYCDTFGEIWATGDGLIMVTQKVTSRYLRKVPSD